jgi:hypothetical protein
MLHKARSIAVYYWVDLERELLAIFGGHEVLMANGQRELLAGLKLSKPIGVGVGGSTRFGVEIVDVDITDLTNGTVILFIRAIGIENDWLC